MSHQLLVVIVLLSACYILAVDARASGSGSRKRKDSGKAVLSAADEDEIKMYQDYLVGSEFTLPDVGGSTYNPVELSSEDEKMEDASPPSSPNPNTEKPTRRLHRRKPPNLSRIEDPKMAFLEDVERRFPQFQSDPNHTNAYYYMGDRERRYWQNK